MDWICEMKIFEKLERLRVEREFEKHVAPGVLELLEKPVKEFSTENIERKHFQFIIVGVAERDLDDIPETIGKVVSTLSRHNATLLSIASSLIVATLGWPFPQNDSAELRMTLVAALLADNANRARIAHGQCLGLVGNLGAEGNRRYGGIIPEFSGIIKKLSDTQFGTAFEVS